MKKKKEKVYCNACEGYSITNGCTLERTRTNTFNGEIISKKRFNIKMNRKGNCKYFKPKEKKPKFNPTVTLTGQALKDFNNAITLKDATLKTVDGVTFLDDCK